MISLLPPSLPPSFIQTYRYPALAIKVVFQVIHNGNSGRVPESVINKQLDVMNEAFAGRVCDPTSDGPACALFLVHQLFYVNCDSIPLALYASLVQKKKASFFPSLFFIADTGDAMALAFVLGVLFQRPVPNRDL